MISVFILCFQLGASLHVRELHDKPQYKALSEWLLDGRPFNLMLTPQYNNQHSMFGITEYLHKQNLFKYLGGVSAGSGGTLPGAFAAAESDFQTFSNHFPKNGWGGLGPSEPKISEDYERLLDATLPNTFEELKHPLGISLTHWQDIDSLKKFDHTRQRGFGISSGNLHEAMIAAVTTSGPDKACPNCTRGFWPRKVNNLFPVTDGAFGDVWGAQGLKAIPYCEKVLHLLPLDYPGQVRAPSVYELPKSPKELVSLVIVQPPVASHSYILEFKAGRTLHNLITKKTSEQWNAEMFNATFQGMKKALSLPLNFTKDGSGSFAELTLDGGLSSRESMTEQMYDRLLSLSRDQFWAFYGQEGSSVWGRPLQAMLLNSKLQSRHFKRLREDITSGAFGPHPFNAAGAS